MKFYSEDKKEMQMNEYIKSLKEGNCQERLTAAKKLGELRCNNAVEPLVLSLMDRELSVRRASWTALEHMEQKSVHRIIKKYISTLSSFFIDELKNSYWPVRSFAARILGKIREKTAIVPLLEALDDREGYVRYFAAEALGKLGEPYVLPYMVKSLIDDLGNTRTYVADSIKYLIFNLPDNITPEDLMFLEETLKKIKENNGSEELSKLFEKIIEEKKTEKVKDFVIIKDSYPEERQLEIICTG